MCVCERDRTREREKERVEKENRVSEKSQGQPMEAGKGPAFK